MFISDLNFRLQVVIHVPVQSLSGRSMRMHAPYGDLDMLLSQYEILHHSEGPQGLGGHSSLL